MLPQAECPGEGGGGGGVQQAAANAAATAAPAAAPAAAPVAAPVAAAASAPVTSPDDEALRKRAAAAIARSKAALTTLVGSGTMEQAEADAIIKSCTDAAAAV